MAMKRGGVALLGSWLAAVGGWAGAQTAPPPIVGLDHIPIAVVDLDEAAERFKALGFVLKPGRPHANGIRNEHAKFPDGTELELITAPEARDDLTSKYRRHLALGDGPAFLAFFAPDPASVSVELPSYVFLSGRQRSPTDRPEHFAHANGADSFIGVWLAGDDLAAERRLLESARARFATQRVNVPDSVTADVARLQEGEVVLLPGEHQRVAGRRIVGATVRVKSLAQTQRALASGGVRWRSVPDAASVFVAPEDANGLWLEFRGRGMLARRE